MSAPVTSHHRATGGAVLAVWGLTATTGVAQQVSAQDQAQVLAGFGTTPAQVEAILGMTRGFDDGFTPEDPRSIATTTPTTLGAWAYENLLPVLSS